MKSVIFILLPGFLALPGTLQANDCNRVSIETIANRITNAWATKKLGTLDKQPPYKQSIQFVIEHSIAEGTEVHEARNLTGMDSWLNKQESEGIPAREARPLEWCKNGLCVFDLSAGISHNHRYVQKLTYTKIDNCFYIRSVFILDGD